ncbi:YrzQ family protein [Bacillus cereus group sp. N11]|nr:YrzQ family protein [Bacillus cereus group sp. N11]MBJ8102211.1 YrzQ family protein [Bacillus cereus group sp. N11]
MNLRNSLFALVVGAAAYQYAGKEDVFSKRYMKKARNMFNSYLLT